MEHRDRSEWGYVIIWQFQVRAGMEKRFEEVYGSDGDWARFFQQDESYIGTELIRDFKAARTYATLDFWVSQEDYDEFRRRHLDEYKAIDQRCEAMTESERELGTFARVTSQ